MKKFIISVFTLVFSILTLFMFSAKADASTESIYDNPKFTSYKFASEQYFYLITDYVEIADLFEQNDLSDYAVLSNSNYYIPVFSFDAYIDQAMQVSKMTMYLVYPSEHTGEGNEILYSFNYMIAGQSSNLTTSDIEIENQSLDSGSYFTELFVTKFTLKRDSEVVFKDNVFADYLNYHFFTPCLDYNYNLGYSDGAQFGYDLGYTDGLRTNAEEVIIDDKAIVDTNILGIVFGLAGAVLLLSVGMLVYMKVKKKRKSKI